MEAVFVDSADGDCFCDKWRSALSSSSCSSVATGGLDDEGRGGVIGLDRAMSTTGGAEGDDTDEGDAGAMEGGVLWLGGS